MLLGGWLLMMPPAGQGDTPDLGAPMQQWDQRAAYDTAKDCESAKSSAYRMATPNTMTERLKNRYAEMRCVPAEHIYPPVEPPLPAERGLHPRPRTGE